TGDPVLRRAADRVADSARRGAAPRAADRDGLPPLLSWVLAAGGEQDALVAALRHAARVYRRRAVHQGEMVRVFLPILLVFAIGASATLFYALTLFVPLADMLGHL